jgi:hypothetical protein
LSAGQHCSINAAESTIGNFKTCRLFVYCLLYQLFSLGQEDGTDHLGFQEGWSPLSCMEVVRSGLGTGPGSTVKKEEYKLHHYRITSNGQS